MKHRNYYRVAALLLAVMMTLGLAACGGSGSGGQAQSGGQVDQPKNSEPVKAPSSVAADVSQWYGVWSCGLDWLLEINSSYALVYDLDSMGDFFDERLCFEGLYDCNYTINGDVLTLNAYDMAGNLFRTMEMTLENGQLHVAGENALLTKLTNNTSAGEDLTGIWYSAVLPIRFGSSNEFSGDRMTFYQDGTCLIQWSDGSSETHDGYYQMTTKFDNPAIRMVLDGLEGGTYEYEFLTNDLLMIYTDHERVCGFLLYRE